jgi:hypothetical protein
MIVHDETTAPLIGGEDHSVSSTIQNENKASRNESMIEDNMAKPEESHSSNDAKRALKRKRDDFHKATLSFAPNLVASIHVAPYYDRKPTDADLFKCDVCYLSIPGGIRGFEVYATCPQERCDGYDLCASCMGEATPKTAASSSFFEPDEAPWSVRVKGHRHKLHVIDRQAEVQWSNNGA